MYGTGGIFVLNAISWVVYGLGWHIHPKLYPLLHVTILDLLAETMIWIRTESTYSDIKQRVLVMTISLVAIVAIPTVFLVYAKFLFWLWIGEDSGWMRIIG